jgi:hypothetical protein
MACTADDGGPGCGAAAETGTAAVGANEGELIQQLLYLQGQRALAYAEFDRYP